VSINITELQSIFAGERKPENLESLIIRLYSAGVPPTEITTTMVAKVFGYKNQSSYFRLAKPYGGLTILSEQLLPYYEPKVQFDLDNFLIGQSNSMVDRVYEKVIENPGILEKELEESLNSNQRTILNHTGWLTDFGWIVPVRAMENRRRQGFKYFPTKYADQVSPSDLKLFKSVRKKSTFEYLTAIYLFHELSKEELSNSFKKSPHCLYYLDKRDILESSKEGKYKKYRLTKNFENSVSHILSYFLGVNEKVMKGIINPIRSRILKHRLTRIVKDKGLRLKKTLQTYNTVENGIKDFDIKLEDDIYVAIPEKSMRPEELKKTASSYNILIKDDWRRIFPKKTSYSEYRKCSHIISSLIHRPI